MQDRGRRRIAARNDRVNAVGVFAPRGDGIEQSLAVLTDRVFGDVCQRDCFPAGIAKVANHQIRSILVAPSWRARGGAPSAARLIAVLVACSRSGRRRSLGLLQICEEAFSVLGHLEIRYVRHARSGHSDQVHDDDPILRHLLRPLPFQRRLIRIGFGGEEGCDCEAIVVREDNARTGSRGLIRRRTFRVGILSRWRRRPRVFSQFFARGQIAYDELAVALLGE